MGIRGVPHHDRNEWSFPASDAFGTIAAPDQPMRTYSSSLTHARTQRKVALESPQSQLAQVPLAQRAARPRAALLQASVGNQAVLRGRVQGAGVCESRASAATFGSGGYVVGPTDAAAERDADAAAKRALAVTPGTPAAPDSLTRKGHAPSAPQRGAVVQRKAETHARASAPGAGVAAFLTSHAGEPLAASVRADFEPRFGRDFGDVRVHTGPAAAASARSIQALAYAVGDHIVFRDGAYAPSSPSGRALLAHELAHVDQGQQLVRRKADPAASFDAPTSGSVDVVPQQAPPNRIGTPIARVEGAPLKIVRGVGRYEELDVARTAARLALHAAAPRDWDRSHSAVILLSQGHFDVYLLAGTTSDVSFKGVRFNHTFGTDGSYTSTRVTVERLAGAGAEPPWELVSVLTSDGVELASQSSDDRTSNLVAETDLGFSAGRALSSYEALHGPGLSAAGSREQVLATFEMALREVALRAISEAEPRMRVMHLRMHGDVRYNQSDLAIIRELVPLLTSARAATKAADRALFEAYRTKQHNFFADVDIPAHQAALKSAQGQEALLYDQYPLLRRVGDFDAFADAGDRERAKILAGVLGGVLRRLPEAREWITRGTLPGLASPLWTNPSLVEKTIAELGITDERMQGWIRAEASSQETLEKVENAALFVVSIALLIGSFFASGGTSLAVAAAGAATNLGSQTLSTREVLQGSYLSATDIDPEKALGKQATAADEAMLFVGWALLPLDALQIKAALAEYRALRLAGTIDRSAVAMRRFVASRLATKSLTTDELVKLAEGAARRTILAQDLPRLQTILKAPVEIVPALEDGIRVVPSFDRFGFVSGVTVQVGNRASLAVLAHHGGTVDAYRRVGGLLGRAEELLRRLRSRWVGPQALSAAADARSAGFEAIEEVRKLRGVVADVNAELARAVLRGDNVEATALRLDRYQAQLAEQNARLEAHLANPKLAQERGVGYVAAQPTGAPLPAQLAHTFTPQEAQINQLGEAVKAAKAKAAKAEAERQLAVAHGKRAPQYLEADAKFQDELRRVVKAQNELEAAQRAAGITPDQLYDRLRGRTPNASMDLAAQAKGNIDPIYGHVVSGSMSPDHIVPVYDIVRMPGFAKLPTEMQLEVLNLAENTMGLDAAVNFSKGDRLWSAAPGSSRYWEGYSKLGPIDPVVRQKMIVEEAKARAALQKAIKDRLSKLMLQP